ncbi:MAG TPA: hypothetical protein VLM37_10575 [Fibrobacteraceae bacterium]|nr:hypothetical protein [Fibrobacteraceae bacterium]
MNFQKAAFVCLVFSRMGLSSDWEIYGENQQIIELDSITALDSTDSVYVSYTYDYNGDTYPCVAWRAHNTNDSDTVIAGACEYGNSIGQICVGTTVEQLVTEVLFLDSIGALLMSDSAVNAFISASDTVQDEGYGNIYWADLGYFELLDGGPSGCFYSVPSYGVLPEYPSATAPLSNRTGVQGRLDGSLLHWAGALYGPYRVVVLDVAGREVFRSGVLSASGSIEVSLPAGHGHNLVQLENLASGKIVWGGWISR